MKKNLSWYINRLKKMSISEVNHRFFELTLLFYDKLYFKSGWRSNGNEIDWDVLGQTDINLNPYKSILLHALKPKYRDNIVFDNTHFFKFQSSPENTDLRAVWDASRFNNVLLSSFDDNNVASVHDLLANWMKLNRPLIGVNYISTMECAIRCINLYAALINLPFDKVIKHDLSTIASEFFYTNYVLIKHRISKYSSRGNHTLFEYCGLATCAKALGFVDESKVWIQKFCVEFDLQTNKDGSGVEQSTAYHLFNVEALCFVDKYLQEGSSKSRKFQASIKFLSSILNENKIIRIGDSDSSILFTNVFVMELVNNYRFNSDRYHEMVNYSDCGIFSHRNESYSLIFKYGFLGMAPLFGHGHYNFLSIILSDNNGDLITADDQTYLYSSKLRSELRSSKSHSMPSFENDDIQQLTPFSWDEGRTGELLYSDEEYVSARYIRNDSLGLKRTVEFNQDYLIVIDEKVGKIDDSIFFVNWNVLSCNVGFHFFAITFYGEVVAVSPCVNEIYYSSSYNLYEDGMAVRKTIKSKSTYEKIVTLITLSDNLCVETLVRSRFS
ncbi:heparinase II/III domain-containing protein [Shewanella algae]|uniref:heparinase II/III domain-containing protein n=1 Tax=Shewanella algae TaxID=38313 RepID=UPI001C56614C|nr:heparinase II/III family protein [Shewanella algae]